MSELPEPIDEPSVPQPVIVEKELMTPQPEEVVAAKWYTTGFLVAIGLLSILGLIAMVIVAIRMLKIVVY